MAENLIATRSSAAQQLGQKASPAALNRGRWASISMQAAYASIGNGDTVATGLVLPAGAKLVGLPVVSNAANNASVTLSVGIRDAITKVAVDATALVNALAINAAGNAAIATGTKMITGQEYTLPQDCELYLTIGGAASLANAQIRVDIPWVAP